MSLASKEMPPRVVPEQVAATEAAASLAADNWDGNQLDQRFLVSRAATVPSMTKTSMKFAAKAVGHILPAGHDLEFARILGPGEHFDAWRYALGTVVVFNQQLLFPGEPDWPYVGMRALTEAVAVAGKTAPEPPTSLEPPLGDAGHLYAQPRYLEGGNLILQNRLRYGVVAPARKGKTAARRLISIHAGSVYRDEREGFSGRLHPDQLLRLDKGRADFRAEPQRLTVGRVYHMHRRVEDGEDEVKAEVDFEEHRAKAIAKAKAKTDEARAKAAEKVKRRPVKHVTIPALMRVTALAIYQSTDGWMCDLST
jgi:hypothetical protein